MLLSLRALITTYRLRPNGVLHLGAHLGEEAAIYEANRIREVVWVEANPKLIPQLEAAVGPYGHRVIQGLLGDRSGEAMELLVTNNSQSSSILRLGTHRLHHPDIDVTERIPLETRTVDDLVPIEQASALNFLNIDLQGAELLALRGAERVLAQAD